MHELLLPPGRRANLTGDAGRCLGRLHEALAGRPPAARPPTGLAATGERVLASAWHVDLLGRADPSVVGADQAAGLATRLDRLDRQLVEAGLRRTLIHGDYGPYNVLLRPGASLLVVDFELARDDWMLTDVATAIPRFASSRLGFSTDRADAFLAGYLEMMPDLRPELPQLPAVLEYLSLRRTAVCLERHGAGQGASWAREAHRHASLAGELASGRHPLARWLGSRLP
jgi:Ser/Thr protein kinase RdoA (MazF antagonist)